ncbi:hypothetical protein [Vibrio crassostreae]|uniref:hypothetical protein n=1 Tax=Vibrio crassostreae TaxID=246167 RepID=UPI001B311277|nr:hypothetical protein [Vibrio crassostreae]
MAWVWTQERMINAARGYEEALCDPDETQSSFSPELGDWEYRPEMDITELGKKLFGTPEEALKWLEEEITVFDEDGLDFRSNDFRSMLVDPIKEEIIIGNSEDGMELWDGTHRVAAAYAKNKKCPAIIGTRNSNKTLL